MAQFALIFICLSSGFCLKKWHLVDANAHKVLNVIVLNLALPAMTLAYIPAIEIKPQLIFTVAMPWLNLLLAWLVFALIGKKYGWDKSLIGAVVMMVGFGNTSFIGIPVIEALYGAQGLRTVIMIDQPGSFVALTTLGIVIVNLYANRQRFALKNIFINMLKFPPLIAFIIGLSMNISGLNWSVKWHELLLIFSKMVVPLALISVGMQWQLDPKHLNSKVLWVSLLFKLILFPMLVFIILALLLQQSGEIIEIIVLEAAMAPMITAGILAITYNLQPQYCNMMLGVGIPLSFLSLTIWYTFLQWWF